MDGKWPPGQGLTEENRIYRFGKSLDLVLFLSVCGHTVHLHPVTHCAAWGKTHLWETADGGQQPFLMCTGAPWLRRGARRRPLPSQGLEPSTIWLYAVTRGRRGGELRGRPSCPPSPSSECSPRGRSRLLTWRSLSAPQQPGCGSWQREGKPPPCLPASTCLPTRRRVSVCRLGGSPGAGGIEESEQGQA